MMKQRLTNREILEKLNQDVENWSPEQKAQAVQKLRETLRRCEESNIGGGYPISWFQCRLVRIARYTSIGILPCDTTGASY
jgi:hypothetical protein